MNQLTILGNNILTMSSLEIAELVQSRHYDVKRSIERLAGKGVIRLPPMAFSENINNLGFAVKSEMYVFTGEQGKLDSITVVAQLCPQFTAALVKRWYELESQQHKLPQALPDFTNPAVAARAWAEQFEQREKAERNLAIAGGALIRLGASDGSMCLRAAAKCLGMRQMDFIRLCLQHGYLFRDGQGKLEAYAYHTQSGWFEHKADEANGHAYKQVLVTPKGLMKLAQKLEVVLKDLGVGNE